MKKYIFLSFYQFKSDSMYKLNTFFAVISSLVFVLINYSIWRSLYQTGNISQQQFNITISHVVVINVINQIINRNFEERMGEKIVSGDIAYYMIKPTNVLGKLIAEHMGSIFYNLTFSALPLILLTCGLLDVLSVIVLSNIGLFIISTILSLITIVIFEAIIGLLCIFIYQIFGLSLIKSSLINILAGITIPITYYPDIIKDIFIILPFYSALNAPVSILLNEPYYVSGIGRYFFQQGWSSSIYVSALIEQGLWIILLVIVIFLLWNHLIHRINIQGG